MNHPTTSTNPPFNHLSRFYITALSIIALLTITGFFLIQWALYQQSSDAHLINIAGRQRVLSENLSKTALIIKLSTDTNQQRQYLDKFHQVLTLWEQTHNNLCCVGDTALSDNNSTTVTHQFAELQPHYQAMKTAAQNLLAAAWQNSSVPSAALSELIKQIVTQQPTFVQQMDAIVSQYEAEAMRRMTQVKIIVFLIATLILIVLLLEGIYLFRPVVAEIRKLNLELEQRVNRRTTQLETTSQQLETEITTRQQAEENFLLYKMAITETYEGITIADARRPDIPLIYVNPAFERITGYTSAELIGQNSRFLHGGDRDQPALDEVREAIREGKNCHVVLRNYRKDGSLFWNQLNISPMHDATGHLTHFVGIQLDITAQKQAEQALQASEERYRLIVDTTQEGICILDANARLTFLNQRLADMLGYSVEEMQGRFLFELFDKAVHIEAKQHFEQCKQGIKEQFDFRFLREDGSQAWTMICANPFFDDNGQFMGALGMITDITERKQAEETLRNIVNGVASAGIGTNFIKSLVEHLTKTLHVKYAFIGQRRADDPEKIVTLFLVADNHLVDNIEYDLQHTPCEKVIYNNELCYYPQNVQQIFPLDTLLVEMGIESYFGTPLFNADGKTIGLMVIMDDKPLTHQKQIESMLQIFAARASAELERIEALNALHAERASLAMRVKERTAELTAANAELARAASLKDEFLACMSHELRTPLNAILGRAEMLQDGIYGIFNTEQSKSIRTIEESGRHLLSLINDILDLAKIDAGKVKLEIIPVSVEGIGNASRRLIKELALKKHIKISVNYDSAVTIIQADERYLKQILINLLTNAVKFTPAGGDVNLEVRGQAEQGMVEFIVSDTGIGIAEKDMKRLFKPFVQLDARLKRAYEGTGLGLSLVYRLTELHGGSVSVKSEINKGSRFIVSLPWQPVTDTLPSADVLVNSPAPQADIPSSSALILLVDDNITTLETVYDYLEARGYHDTLSYDGTQAIEKTLDEHPDLILMDIQMPRMDGLEATRRIRANPEIAATPIIALTALAMSGDRERCLEAGANDYLSKPVSFKKLKAAIEAQLH
jgi:PAS domain S-box-containing protein